MIIIIVVSNTNDWKFNIPGVEVISSKVYLTNPEYVRLKNARIFNLSRSYKYQNNGYYVSLLAAARRHVAIPSIATIQDMKSQAIVKIISNELDELIQKSLSNISSQTFVLSIYFGKNIYAKYNRLSLQLFNLFQAPLLRAHFVHSNKWYLQSISPISASEIPDDHKPFVEEFATVYFQSKRFRIHKRDVYGYDLAILIDPKDPVPPSSEKTLQKFLKGAESVGLNAYLITKDDYSRLAEFDGLFIRDTTAVNHYTFQFSQRAHAEGLAVIDDPVSIIRCSNKVYLTELLKNNNILAPKSMVLHNENIAQVKEEMGFPCILKQPDSSFSMGVIKVENEKTFDVEVERLLGMSDLIVVQEFLPTEFDWRVGIFDNEVLYVCKYFMAKKHWQIIDWKDKEKARFGKAETIPVELAPAQLIKTALNCTRLIGNGLYGVDVKQIGKKFYIIEINDNPSIDTGIEDAVSKDKLYTKIMEIFLKKIQNIKNSKKNH